MAHAVTPERPTGLATASLTLALAGICLIPIVPSILAVIFGHMAQRTAYSQRASAGIILGYLMLSVYTFGAIVALTE